MGRSFRALARTRAGLVGFVGLVFYAVLVFVGPLFVPFDSEVKTDQVNAPPGSRLQLVTRAVDVERYGSLGALEGRVVGFVSNWAGESLVEPLEDTFTDTEDYRRGAGLEDGLEELAEGDTDALVLFSESLKTYPIGPGTDFPDLAVANARLAAPHLLGTDTQGRDIFSHIVNGGRTLIATALLAGLISTTIAVLLDATAALVGDPSTGC